MGEGIIIKPTKQGTVESFLIPLEEVLAHNEKFETVIDQRIDDLVRMIETPDEDPAFKSCSKCVKEGRFPLHPVENFSVLKNGKKHSQCKRCRTDQANAWCAKKKKHRREYHRKYRETHEIKPSENNDTRLRKDLHELYVAAKG